MGDMLKEYDTEFIKRTQTLIKNYNGKYTITLLLNCLLGLIVLPNEFYKKRKIKFLDQEVDKINDIKNITSNPTLLFNPTKKKNGFYESDKKSLRNFLKKIRNGIAHQRIEAINEKGKWTKVKIKDINEQNNNIELEIELTIRELREFALFISTKYIEEIDNIIKK